MKRRPVTQPFQVAKVKTQSKRLRYKLGLAAWLLLLLTAGCAAVDPAPAVLFLRPGPNGAAQLYVQPAGAASARQLTGVEDPAAPEVIDYAAAPDGVWLSYVSPTDEGVVLYQLSDGAQRLLNSRVGSPAAFSPDSAVVVYSDIVVQAHDVAPENEQGDAPLQESSSTFLYRTRLDEDSPRQRLSPDAAVADSVPAFSPDGQWIAFGRAPAGTDAARQLWLMRPDGGEARALTADPTISNGPPSWSPDGRYLLFQRYDPVENATSVWRLEVATGAAALVAEGGYLPGWLP